MHDKYIIIISKAQQMFELNIMGKPQKDTDRPFGGNDY